MLEGAAESSDAPAMRDPQQFRLQKIGELEVFLRSEVERRSRLHKKYRRAVNAFDSTSAALGLICVGTGSVGAGLLASGIGFVPGLVLEVVTGFAGLLDVVGVAPAGVVPQKLQSTRPFVCWRCQSSTQFTRTLARLLKIVRSAITSTSDTGRM